MDKNPQNESPDAYRVFLNREQEGGRPNFGQIHIAKIKDESNLAEAAVFSCYTLELPWKDNQRCASCIPADIYPLKEDRAGRFFDAYAERWKHEYVVQIDDVPDRSDILTHTGVIEKHTLGCILTGREINRAQGKLMKSRAAYAKWYIAIDKYKPKFIDIKYLKKRNG